MEEIKIPIGNKKIILLLLGSLIFVAIGIWFIIEPESLSTSTRPRNPYFLRIIGIISVGFFGLCFILMIIKLLDKRFKGIIINEKGIYENSTVISIGLIEWEDIKGFETIEVEKSKTIIILTDKPKKYIDKAPNTVSKKLMNLNWKGFKSPLQINTVPLKIKSVELERILNEYLEHYQPNRLY